MILSPRPSSPTTADTVTLTAIVKGASPTGTVVFKDGATTLGTVALTNGSASMTTTFAAGAHTLSAAYSGDAQNPAATTSLSIVVT